MESEQSDQQEPPASGGPVEKEPTCAVCGQYRWGRRKYCSDLCGRIAHRVVSQRSAERRKDAVNEKRRLKRHALKESDPQNEEWYRPGRLAGVNPQPGGSFEPSVCPICFKPRGRRPKYCSDLCATIAKEGQARDAKKKYRESPQGKAKRKEWLESEKARRAEIRDHLAAQAEARKAAREAEPLPGELD